ncbi:MAG: hypothetical protein K6G40_00995 [Eubacterium sp.]|nr:hypothetical protein [Eubacterium sp.]
MKKKGFKLLAALLIFVVAAASVFAYLILGIDRDAEQNNRILTAQMVEATVGEALAEPIAVSNMICRDSVLKTMLIEEDKYSEEEMVEMMNAYLGTIKNRFDFSLVYVISDNTKRYYTESGISKIVDPESDAYDHWYEKFVEGDALYSLDSSTDEANRNQLTIFIDGRVVGESGEVLGVAGVGIQTENMQTLLSELETQYGVTIDYISEDGLVQLSSRENATKSSYVSGIELPEGDDEEYLYEIDGEAGYAVVKYIEEYDWYMVIRGNLLSGNFGYNYQFFFAELIIMNLVLIILFIATKNMQIESADSSDINRNVDSVTGLPNRDYFIRVYGEKGKLNTTQYQSIAEFGIDEFENVEKRPEAERIIHSVVRTAREIFGEEGQIIQWNKSSFLVLFELPVSEAEERCKEFCKAVHDIGDTTVSVGLTYIELDESLKKNYYRAVQSMYLVKELGGNNVKRG